MGFKRSLGLGTFFAVTLTGGSWLLALPFYPQRCIGCGVSRDEAQAVIRDAAAPALAGTPTTAADERLALVAVAILGLLAVVSVLLVVFRG